MSQRCELTGIRPGTGHNVSHANNKTKRRFSPNLKRKRYTIPELRLDLTLRLSTRAIRTIDKHGSIARAIRKARFEELSPRLQTLRNRLDRQASTTQAPGGIRSA